MSPRDFLHCCPFFEIFHHPPLNLPSLLCESPFPFLRSQNPSCAKAASFLIETFPKTSLFQALRSCFKAFSLTAKMWLNKPCKLYPSHQFSEIFHLQPHVFKSERCFSFPNPSTIKKDWCMIKDRFWKDALKQTTEVVLPIFINKETILA